MDTRNNLSLTPYDETYHDYGPLVISVLSITMVIFMFLAFMGNTLVILTVIRHKGMKTRTNMFIVNLAVADILVAIFNMPFSLITIIQGNWIFNDAFCQFNGFLVPLLFIVSIHTLMYIGIHKYISITRPFSQFMTPRKIQVMIATSWVWGGICAGLTLKGGNHVLYKKGASQCGPSIPDELYEYLHSLMITTCNYIIPLAVMSFCYYNIFREIHEHMHRLRETSNVDLENSLDQQKRISCTLFWVLACFFVCWTPFIIYSCTAAFRVDKTLMPLLANPAGYWCGYMNSACNPIIYALRSKSFRRGYKEILCSYHSYSVGGSLVSKSPKNQSIRQRNKVWHEQHSSESGEGGKLLTFPSLKSSTISGNRVLIPYSTPVHRPRIVSAIGSPTKRKSFSQSIHELLDRRLRNPERTMSLVEVNRMLDELRIRSSLKRHSSPTCNRNNSNVSVSSDTGVVYPSYKSDGRSLKSRSLSYSVRAPVTSESMDSLYYDMGSRNTVFIEPIPDVDQQESVQGPLVVIDAASLKSSVPSDGDRASIRDRRMTDSGTNRLCLDCTSVNPTVPFPNGKTAQTLSVESWSPSVRSLEMGRSHSRKCGLNNPPRQKLSEGFIEVKLSKDSSPLYGASKDQLMKWMSEDYLDKLEAAEGDMHLVKNHSSSINRNFSFTFLSPLKKNKKVNSTSDESSTDKKKEGRRKSKVEDRY